jgi:hypothetical protein
MELARITLITAHAVIIPAIHHVMTGSETSIPLKIVAVTASRMEIARIVTGLESTLLVVTTGLGLIPTNRACARSMISNTPNTNAVVMQIDLIRQDTVQITAQTLSNTTHDTRAVINTAVRNGENLIGIPDRLAVSTAISNMVAILTGKAGNLTVMIVISDLLETMRGLLHGTHVGRVARPDNVATMPAGLSTLPEMRLNSSCSKVTMSILMQVTKQVQTNLQIFKLLRPQRENQSLARTRLAM